MFEFRRKTRKESKRRNINLYQAQTSQIKKSRIN